MNLLISLEEKLGKGTITENEILANHCTWRVGGPARFWYEAKSSDSLIKAIFIAQELGLPYFVLGGGSNILFSDSGFNGLLIKNSSSQIKILATRGKINNKILTKDVYVESETGVTFNRLVRFTLEDGLSGMEPFLGQPGTVGGAMYINAHFPARKKFIGDLVHSAKILKNDGKVEEVVCRYFKFGYDESCLQHTKEIVLSVVFRLTKSVREKVWEEANKTIAYRQISQPQGYPTAGCTFRNISKADALVLSTPNFSQSAGFLIDKCGLKGHSVGGAQISDKHANFIINKNHAKAGDILKLIELCKKQVKNKFGASLREEIVYVGDF